MNAALVGVLTNWFDLLHVLFSSLPPSSVSLPPRPLANHDSFFFH